MYYACLEFKLDKHGKDGQRAKIIKVKFNTKQEAHDYISANFNPEIHSSCWTE